MAYSGEADEDFKLPLRPWLEKQINSKRFTGLEWEPCGGNSKEFRLPWVKKNSPNWEEYYKIFRAWAEHRGRGEAEKLDDSKLKSNFRCALNKSVDFEEVASKSQLHKQTGNYKVYRILSPKEVRERKKKRTKVQTKQELDCNSGPFSTVDKKSLKVLDIVDTSTSGISSLDPNTVLSTIDSNLHSPTFFMPESHISACEVTVPSLDAPCQFLAISQSQNLMNENALSKDIPMGDDSTNTVTVFKEKRPVEDIDSGAKSLILQQLENGGIKGDQLRQCQVIVTCNGEKVVDKEVTRMDEGCWIFSGNRDDKIRMLQKCDSVYNEKFVDLKLSIQIPSSTERSRTTSAILDNIDLSLIICYDPQTLKFYVKRLCRTQIFFFDPHDHSTNVTPTQLEKDVAVDLFSHERYFIEYLEQFVNTHNVTPPEAEIVLIAGEIPKCKVEIRTMKGVKIELVPHALNFSFRPETGLEGPTFRSREPVLKS